MTEGIIDGPIGHKMVPCPKCGQYYRPKDLGPVIIRCRKDRLADIIAPIEAIQATQLAIVEHCSEGYAVDELKRQLTEVNGAKFKDDQMMPCAAMLCAFCIGALNDMRDSENLVSVTIPDKINGRFGVTHFSEAILGLAGVPIDANDGIDVED